jgi:beta-phosphoglucomutase
MIKNIIFDLDGVLFDSLEFHRKIYLDALRTFKPDCPIDNEYFIKNLDSMSTKSRTALLVSQGFLNSEEGERVCKLKQEITADKLKEYVFDGSRIREVVNYFKMEGYKIFCVSNSVGASQRTILAGLGLISLFDGLVNSDDINKPKPDPEPYLLCFSKFGLIANQSLIIEDSDIGFRAAVESKARVLKVGNTYDVTIANIIAAIQLIDKTISDSSTSLAFLDM